jgi:acid stress-induced BolA-like protein IbaG/YrbA
MAAQVEVQKMKKKLGEVLKEKLKADRVSVESEGPEEDRRLMLTVVSPQFRGLTKVEDRDSLIWEAIKVAHTHTHTHTHHRTRTTAHAPPHTHHRTRTHAGASASTPTITFSLSTRTKCTGSST